MKTIVAIALLALLMNACAGFDWGRGLYAAGGGRLSRSVECESYVDAVGVGHTKCFER